MKKRLIKLFKSLTLIEWLQLIGIIAVTIIAAVVLFKILFVGPTITQHTPVGDYTCKGGIIKVCSGSTAVYNYLGI